MVATALLCRIPSPQRTLYLGRGYDRHPSVECGDGTLVGHMDPDVSLDTVIPHDLRGIWTFVGYAAVPLKILVNRVLFV